MIDIRPVTHRFAVSAQIQPGDMQTLAQRGFVTVVCNRPEGEEEGQPPIEALRRAADEAGLAFHHIPVSGGEFPEAAVAAFGAVRKEAQGPILAYCRSGMRAITLETLANPDGLSAAQRLRNAADAGYDLSAIADQLGH